MTDVAGPRRLVHELFPQFRTPTSLCGAVSGPDGHQPLVTGRSQRGQVSLRSQRMTCLLPPLRRTYRTGGGGVTQDEGGCLARPAAGSAEADVGFTKLLATKAGGSSR